MRQFKKETGSNSLTSQINKQSQQDAQNNKNANPTANDGSQGNNGGYQITGQLSDLVSPIAKPDDEETHMTSEYGS